MIKAADMMIARRADTRARADFATWKMMAKLNGASSLPAEAQAFLARYKALLKKMPEPEATEATINLIYQSYYAEMGGIGTAPDVQGPFERSGDQTTSPPSNARRPSGPSRQRGSAAKPRLPVALIFACLVVVYVGIRYYLR